MTMTYMVVDERASGTRRVPGALKPLYDQLVKLDDGWQVVRGLSHGDVPDSVRRYRTEHRARLDWRLGAVYTRPAAAGYSADLVSGTWVLSLVDCGMLSSHTSEDAAWHAAYAHMYGGS